MKRYKYGMLIGRFQPFHVGHKAILERALEECDKVVVLLGSAQEARVLHNPLTSGERWAMIQNCFPNEKDRIEIFSVQDRATVSNDESWGEYLFNTLKEERGIIPEVIYEGRESIRKNW